jgi:formylglycine-generating enzyme required for sulfatase activity
MGFSKTDVALVCVWTRTRPLACIFLAATWFLCVAGDVPAQGVSSSASRAGAIFRDCSDCPEMVVVPPGGFVMGSPANEEGRDPDEGPQRTVNIGRAFAVGKFEVTRGQYATFANETNRRAQGNCWYFNTAQNKYVNDEQGKDWVTPGFTQGDDHPVVCVTWEDAKAYTQWLSRKTGRDYRLLTEAEWEYAARAYSSTSRPWGDDPAQACSYANVRDRSFARLVPLKEGFTWGNLHECDDGIGYTASVGRYQPNRFGLYDMIGNAWEWVEDCGDENYVGAYPDERAWTTSGCARRVARGGGWLSDTRVVRSAHRVRDDPTRRNDNLGFRLARTL